MEPSGVAPPEAPAATALAIRPQSEFTAWLLERIKKLGVLLGLVGFSLGTVGALAGKAFERFGTVTDAQKQLIAKGLPFAPFAINLLVIVVGIFVAHERLDDDRLARPNAAQKQLSYCWQAIWVLWGCYYALLLINEFHANQWLTAVAGLLNTVQGSLFWAMFFVLEEQTVEQDTRGMRLTLDAVPWGPLVVVPLALGAIQLWCANSAVATPVPVMLVVGIWNGMSLALFAARMESKRIDLPSLVVSLFYVYAVIQPAEALFSEHPYVQYVLFTLAGALKAVMLVATYWFFTSDAALFYFASMENMDIAIRASRSQFRETRRTGERLGTATFFAYDLFISAAMEAHSGDAETYKAARNEVMDLVRFMKEELAVKSVFFAGEKIPSPDSFETAEIALQTDLEAIAGSRYFLLWYPVKISSSVLVEAGIALASRKPVVVLTKDKKSLPFLLREAVAVRPSQVRILEFSTTEMLHAQLKANWQPLLASLEHGLGGG